MILVYKEFYSQGYTVETLSQNKPTKPPMYSQLKAVSIGPGSAGGSVPGDAKGILLWRNSLSTLAPGVSTNKF